MVMMPTTGNKTLISIFDNSFEPKLQLILYKFRFLVLYVIFGFFALVIEILLRSFLMELGIGSYFSTIIGWICGVFFAFWTNVNINFKIHKSGIKKALIYFISISIISGLMQWSLIQLLILNDLSYEQSRLSISGIMFLFAYFIHREYSFKDYKKVGVAVYANGRENIKIIHDKIGQYPDFIHVDIIDKTMCENHDEAKPYKMETIKAYWPKTQIQTHIMSTHPTKWLKDVLPFSDVIFVHYECKENLKELFTLIKGDGKKIGMALTMNTNIKKVTGLIKNVDYVLLLTIPNPGNSGQKFDTEGLTKIKEINNLPFRENFNLCVDGGVNEDIVNILEAENIVSGSSVLKNQNPKRQIMRLQTSSRYEAN